MEATSAGENRTGIAGTDVNLTLDVARQSYTGKQLIETVWRSPLKRTIERL